MSDNLAAARARGAESIREASMASARSRRRVHGATGPEPDDPLRHPLYGRMTPFLEEVLRKQKAGVYKREAAQAMNAGRTAPKPKREPPSSPPPPKHCAHCGALVVGARITRRYCDTRCRNLAQYAREKAARRASPAQRKSLKCAECRKAFVPVTGNQKFCSKRCQVRARSRRYRRRRTQ